MKLLTLDWSHLKIVKNIFQMGPTYTPQKLISMYSCKDLFEKIVESYQTVTEDIPILNWYYKASLDHSALECICLNSFLPIQMFSCYVFFILKEWPNAKYVRPKDATRTTFCLFVCLFFYIQVKKTHQHYANLCCLRT